MVLRQIVMPAQEGKLQLNWEIPYHIYQKLPYEAYKLEELDGWLISQNLEFTQSKMLL